MNLGLRIGMDPDDKYWLCLVDVNTDELFEVALFVDKNRMDAFTLWMEAKGFISLKLPTPEELEDFG